MIKSVKRLGAAVLSAVMMLTAVATPLGDNLPAVRDSASLTARADSYWVGSSTYGYYANNSTALNEVKAIMSKNCSSSEIARFNKILSEFPLSGYFNSYKTKACSWHCSICTKDINELKKMGCRSSFYDDETGKTISCSMADWHNAIQCAGYAIYCYYRFMGKMTCDIITLPKGFTQAQLKSAFSDKTIRTGAHFRKASGHSLCYLTRDDNYIYFIDANAGYNSATGCGSKDKNKHYQTCCKINLHKYTYADFVKSCSSGKLTIYNSSTSKFDSGSTPSTDNVKLLNTSSHYSDEVYSDNAIVHGEVNKPTSYPVTRIGIQVRKDGDSYSNGWSRFDNTQKTYTNSSWMSPWFNIKTELGVTLVHSTRYYYRFYAVVNGKEYWSSENTFVTTGSHSFGSWYTKTSATCTSGGTEERKCSCGAVETRSTSALGHNFGGTYYEAVHPHYYGHKCSRCGYSEKTGGNLDYYYLCSTCTHLTKPEDTNIIGDLVDNSEITIEWTASTSDKLANYWLDIIDPDGKNVVDISTGKTNSYTFTPVKTGTYTIRTFAAPIGNKNGNGSVEAKTTIEIGCNHNYITEVVKPTFESEGYTQYTCTKCGDSYISDYTAKLILSKVTNFKVKSLTSTNVTLQWNKNANASGYEIEQYKGGKWVNVAKITSNATTSYTVKGLAAGTAGYKFRMRAVKDGVYSDYTSALSVNTNPYGVGGFKCSSKSSTSVTLKWNKGTTASGYQLQQYKDGKWVTIYTGTKATNTSYTVKNLKAGTAGYRFRIRAFKTYGNTKQYGSWSNEVKVNTNPYGVGGFKCSSKTSTSVTLKWNKGTTASGYQLQQYKDGKWVTIYTGTKATNTNYTVKNLKAGTAGYRFRIRAYKTYGNTKQYGSWSSEVKVNTNPYGVGGFKVKATAKNSITLGWNKGTTASGYQLQQYKGGKWVTVYTGTKATSTSYTVKSLKSNTSYKFRIRAYKTYRNTKQYGSWSKELTVKTKK